MKSKLKILIVASLFGAILLTVLSLQAQDVFTFTNGPYRTHIVKDLSGAKVGSVQTIYAADVETLKYTTNVGATWLVTGTPMLNPLVVAVKPDDSSILHVGTLTKLYRTTNQGTTWDSKLDNADLVPLRLAISQVSTSVWLMGADTVKRGSSWTTSLYRTTDGGATWSASNYFGDNAHSNINDVVFDPTSPATNKAWVGGSSKPADQTPDMTDEGSNPSLPTKGVWYSTDNGSNWSFKAGTMGSGKDRNVTALAYSNKSAPLLLAATRLYEDSTLKSKLYQSSDNGTSWSQRADLFSQLGVSYVRALQAIGAKPETLVAATDKGFAISTNRGTDWTLHNPSQGDIQTAYQVYVDKNYSSGDTLYLATDPTIYKSTDGGLTWNSTSGIYSWLNTAGLSMNNGAGHGVGNSFSRIGRFYNSAWESIPAPVGQGSFSGNAVSINPVNASYAVAGGDSAGYAVLYYRSDGGNGWRRVSTAGSSGTTVDVLASDYKITSQRVYAGGFLGSGNFAYSPDRGVAWYGSVVGNDGSVHVLSLAIDSTTGVWDSGIIYAGMGTGFGVYRSSDAGSTWSINRLNGNSVASIATNVASPNTVYFSSLSYIWKTTDKLASTPSVLSPPFTGAKKIFMHPSYPTSPSWLWAITGDGQHIYKTGNGGSNWSQVLADSQLPKPLNDLQKDPTSNSLIYVATAAGVYKIDPAPEVPGSFAVTGTRCTPCTQGPQIGACNPKPQWSANQEVDLNSGGAYEIWRSTTNHPAMELIATTNSTNYIDYAVEISSSCNAPYQATYQVRAKDAGGSYSPYTGTISVKATTIPASAAHVNMPEEGLAPIEYKLDQNTPNPFNPVTTIKYALAEDVHVTIYIYDILGREVAKVVDEDQRAGYKTLRFDGGNLSSGVYIYRITAGSFTEAKKMILAK